MSARRRTLAALVVIVVSAGLLAVPSPSSAAESADRLAAALADLADDTQRAAASVAEGTTASARLTRDLSALHESASAVAARAETVQSDLAAGRLDDAGLVASLTPEAEKLVAAVAGLGSVAATAEPAVPVNPADLLAPAISALADALTALAPALEALAPVLAPLAPALVPACGQVPGIAFLALGLAPILLPVELPIPDVGLSPTVLAGSLLAPVFLVCASLPLGPAGEEEPPPDEEDTDTPEVLPAAPVAPTPVSEAAPIESTGPDTSASDRAETFLQGALLGDGTATPVAVPVAAPRAPVRTITAAPLAALPFLPIDRSSEAAAVAWLVLLMVAATGATVVASRRWPAMRGWEVAGSAGAGIGAVVAAGLGWNGAAQQVTAWAQVPYLVSGGLVAILLAIVSLTLAVARPLARLAQR